MRGGSKYLVVLLHQATVRDVQALVLCLQLAIHANHLLQRLDELGFLLQIAPQQCKAA